MKQVVIIGGGITGLAAAHRLVELSRKESIGLEVVVLEASGRLGGVIQTEKRDGFLLELGPDSFLSEKQETVALARRLGLEPHLQETNQTHRRSFIVRKGRLRHFPAGFNLLAPARLWPFFTSDVLSWKGKARVTMDLLIHRGQVNGDESLASFVRRRLGQEALERIGQPLVGGIYTGDPELLSLRATTPRFYEMERDDRSLIRSLRKQARRQHDGTETTSGARYSLFLTFDQGMQLLVDRLGAQLPAEKIHLNRGVEAIQRVAESTEWAVRLSSGETMKANSICLALPAPAAARLLRETDQVLARELEGITYASTATINLAFRREDISHALDGFGFVVPFIENRSLLACTFSSVKFANRAPDGFVLLRAFVGGALQPELFELDDLEMTSRVLHDLRDLLGIKKSPLFSRLSRWPTSMPQYHVGHLDRIERIENRVRLLPHFSLAGNAYNGVGISDCIRAGESAAEMIFRTGLAN